MAILDFAEVRLPFILLDGQIRKEILEMLSLEKGVFFTVQLKGS